jgi:hypothetical protein
VSPFLDLGRHCVAPRPAKRPLGLAPARHTQAAGWRPAAPAEVQDLSLTRFAQLLALAILGLAGLISLGVGGVVLVQGHAFPAPGVGVREPGPGRLRLVHQGSEAAPEVSRARKVGEAVTHLGNVIKK